jgi:hypothetical protein
MRDRSFLGIRAYALTRHVRHSDDRTQRACPESSRRPTSKRSGPCARLWCSRVDAEAHAQWAGVTADELGVGKYVTLHFMKQAQAPAIGWRGHRYSSVRDYLGRPAKVMREERGHRSA